MRTRACLHAVLLLLATVSAMADVVECKNGDRYNGKVLVLNEKELKLQNEIQGTILIPREKITLISLGAGAPAVVSRQRPLNPVPHLTNGAVQIDPAAVAKVQQQFLGDANPEANQLFQQLVSGLMSGKLDANDIRSKARSTLGDLKDFEKDLGDDEDSQMLRSYMALLQNFVNSTGQPGTNGPAANPQKPITTPTPGAAASE